MKGCVMFSIGIIVITGVVIFVSMVGYLCRMPDVSETAKIEVTAENNEESADEDNVKVSTEDVVVKPLDWFNENQYKFDGIERAMVGKNCRKMSDEDAKELVKISLETPPNGVVGCCCAVVSFALTIVVSPLLFGVWGLAILFVWLPISFAIDIIIFICEHVHRRNVFKRNFIKVYPFLKEL